MQPTDYYSNMQLTDMVTMAPRDVYAYTKAAIYPHDVPLTNFLSEIRSLIKANHLRHSTRPVYLDHPELMEALRVVTEPAHAVTDRRDTLASMIAYFVGVREGDAKTFLAERVRHGAPDNVVRQARALAALVSSGSEHNYYTTVDGEEYDRKLLGAIADATGHGQSYLIDERHIGPIVDAVLDGGKVTPTERATLRKHKSFFTPRAWNDVVVACGLDVNTRVTWAGRWTKQVFGRAIVKMMYNKHHDSIVQQVHELQERYNRSDLAAVDLWSEIAGIGPMSMRACTRQQLNVIENGQRRLAVHEAASIPCASFPGKSMCESALDGDTLRRCRWNVRGGPCEDMPQEYAARATLMQTPDRWASDSRRIVVYGKNGCPHCANAKRALVRHNLPYTYIDLRTNPRSSAHVVPAGFTTVPQIFVDGRFLGGYDALEVYLSGLN